jgi:hypothetical protein
VLPDEETEDGEQVSVRRSQRAQRTVGVAEEDVPAATVVAKRSLRGSVRKLPKKK